MNPSMTLAETEVTLRKAARASGYAWGLAEEAGKTARWLAAYGLPGAETVYAQLQLCAGMPAADDIPDCSGSTWRADGADPLCPIVVAAALGDRVARLLAGEVIEIADCMHPLLLVPALGQAAFQYDARFGLCWPGVEIACYPDGMAVVGRDEDLLAARVASVGCRANPELDAAPRPPSTHALAVDGEVFAAIGELVHRTYVPSSAASRAGAGSSLSDND